MKSLLPSFFAACVLASLQTVEGAWKGGQVPARLRASQGDALSSGSLLHDIEDEILHPVQNPRLFYEAAFESAGLSDAGDAEPPAARQQLYFRPVSVTLHCVMALTIQCLVIYTALAIMRNYDELSGCTQSSLLTETLTAAARSTLYPPMMCMLFVGCRMYVLASTGGLGEPQPWVKGCMITASVGMTLQVILFLNLPMATDRSALGKGVNFSSLAGEQYDIHPKLTEQKFVNKSAKYVIYFCQIICMLMLYGGVTGVIVGVATFQGPKPVSPAVKCTIILTALYFWVFFCLWLVRARADWKGYVDPRSPEGRKGKAIKGATLSASMAVRKAPMLAVLFLGARMRALQLDPPDGMVPLWGQITFYVTTSAIFLEVITCAYVGFRGKASAGYYGIETFKTTRSTHVVQHTFAMIVFIGFVITIVTILFQGPAHQDGSLGRHPLSPTMVAVLQLNCLFVAVAFGQELVNMRSDVFGKDSTMLSNTLVASMVSTNFCPLICVLFVGTRMRALQITQQRGAPPQWAQDSMSMCVFATFLQVVCCLVLPIFTGLSTEVDGDGNAKLDLRPMIGAYAVTAVKYVALAFLHGGVIVVCTAIFVMTPESCQMEGEKSDTMKNIIRYAAFAMITLVISLVLSSAKVVGLAIKFGIESADEKLLGTTITVGSVALSICRGYVNVSNLIVENPPDHDFESDQLLIVDSIKVKINMWRLIKTLGKEFELTHLELTGAQVVFEKNLFESGSLSNVDVIVNHVNSLVGEKTDEEKAKEEEKPKPEEAKPEPEKPKDDKEAEPFVPIIEINRVEIKDIEATIMSNGRRIGTAVLADIDYPNFMDHAGTGDGNLDNKKVAGILVAKILKTLFDTLMANAGITVELAKLGTELAAKKVADTAAGAWNSMFGSKTEAKEQDKDATGVKP